MTPDELRAAAERVLAAVTKTTDENTIAIGREHGGKVSGCVQYARNRETRLGLQEPYELAVAFLAILDAARMTPELKLAADRWRVVRERAVLADAGDYDSVPNPYAGLHRLDVVRDRAMLVDAAIRLLAAIGRP